MLNLQMTPPRIALLVMTDGRDTIFDTIHSATTGLVGPISERWIHDDSGDRRHTLRLRRRFPDWTVVATPRRAGFGGAIRSAWSTLRVDSAAPYIFHLEDDFLFLRPVYLADIVDVLEPRPYLAQMALRRQAWNELERAAGGVVEQAPDDWTDHDDGLNHWLESTRCFTTNPCLYRRSLIREHDWPDGDQSEGRFGHGLLGANPATRFGYWGRRDSGEAVEHIGHYRVGTGY